MTLHFFSAAGRPLNEPERQAEVDRYPDHAYRSPRVAELVGEAQALCGTSIAALSIIDGGRHRLFAVRGLELTEAPRAVSVCAHAILTPGKVTCIGDLREDDRFGCNPFVDTEDGVRFYAGAPVVTANGQALGALCAIDTAPRPVLDEATTTRLRDLAAEIAREVARERRI